MGRFRQRPISVAELPADFGVIPCLTPIRRRKHLSKVARVSGSVMSRRAEYVSPPGTICLERAHQREDVQGGTNGEKREQPRDRLINKFLIRSINSDGKNTVALHLENSSKYFHTSHFTYPLY